MAIDDINGIKNTQVSLVKERNGQTNVTHETSKSAAQNAAVNPIAGGADTVHFTESAKTLHRLTQAVESVPIVDQQRVSEIRSSVQNRSYTIHPQSVANKLLQFESLLPR